MGQIAEQREVLAADVADFSKSDLLGTVAALNRPAPNKGVNADTLRVQLLEALRERVRLAAVLAVPTTLLTIQRPEALEVCVLFV